MADDQGLAAETSSLINIERLEPDINLSEVTPIDFSLTDLLISEFMPDPVGSDEAEWVELYNNYREEINLTGWQLDDGPAGSRPYVFSKGSKIKPGEFLVIKKSDTKLSLNNSNDQVRLLTPLAEVWQEVSYDQAPEGQSQAWDFANGEWFFNP